jgi:hypothetical protein
VQVQFNPICTLWVEFQEALPHCRWPGLKVSFVFTF